MKIKFDPFHLGLKFNTSIIDPKDFMKIKNNIRLILNDLNYPKAIIEKKSILSSNLDVNEILSKNEDIEIVINNIAVALNIRGSDPNIVLDNMVKLEKELRSQYDIPRIKNFYEIVADIQVITANNPEEVLKRKFDLKNLNLYGENIINVSALVLSNDISFRNSNKWFKLTINPSPLSPKTTYALQLVVRFNNLEETKNYIELINSQIQNILAQLGDKNAIST